MKKINLLIALSIGVISSSSGMIQVGAATYNYFVDFSTKEVANYSAYKQSFNQDTSNLDLEVNFKFSGNYRFSSCPTTFTMNTDWALYVRSGGSGGYTLIKYLTLPDLTCTTTNTTYLVSIKEKISSNWLDLIVNDDANYINFYPHMIFVESAVPNGTTFYLSGYRFYFDITYDFNTTYLFNYFLSDQNYLDRQASPLAQWTFNGVQKNYLQYVYTTAGNDSYYIYNSNVNSIGTTRKKYAVDYNAEFFRGDSVGAGFDINVSGTDQVLMDGVSQSILAHRINYYYLNVSNLAQAIVDAPVFNFSYQDCGSFLALNVGCFINNGLAYITNDAPIISDAITLLNAGIELAAQTFGIIGNFADDNIFGFLILVGFGFIAIKWLIKND